MSEQTAALVEATIRQQCKALHMPTIGSQFVGLAAEAVKSKQTHTEYLEALLTAELEEREHRTIQRRIQESHLPKIKTLEDFDFSQAQIISAAQIRELAEGGYIDRAEPVVLTGDCGTGKTHLATALCVAACRQKRRVRFTTATALVNEFVEARHENRVGRLLARWFRYDLVAVDEVGYVPLADIGAEFLYQVVSERAERAALIVTTNLSFSEWTQVFANPRLCKAMVDRVTDRAHIIDTGKESYRFRRTLEARKKKTRAAGRNENHD
jgi:DNA replication protein DnaC